MHAPPLIVPQAELIQLIGPQGEGDKTEGRGQKDEERLLPHRRLSQSDAFCLLPSDFLHSALQIPHVRHFIIQLINRRWQSAPVPERQGWGLIRPAPILGQPRGVAPTSPVFSPTISAIPDRGEDDPLRLRTSGAVPLRPGRTSPPQFGKDQVENPRVQGSGTHRR